MKKNIIWSPRVNKISSFYFNYYLLDLDSFTKLILNNFEFGVTYSILVRIEYDDHKYGMAGTQIPFVLTTENHLIKIELLYNTILDRIHSFDDNYEVQCIESIQLLFVKVNILPQLELKNINNIEIPKRLVDSKDIKTKFNNNLLPLTTDVQYFGKLIVGELAENYLKLINDNHVSLKGVKYHSLYDEMYLYNDKYIILSRKVGNKFIREVFNVSLGSLEAKFADYIVSSDSFIRTYKDVNLLINKGEIDTISISKELPIIKKEQYAKTKKNEATISNPYIGSFDIETFNESDDFAKIYAVGYCLLNKEPNIYYLDKDSEKDVLLECINDMLSKRYNDYLFYIHNINFDGFFIIHKLEASNLVKGFQFYKLDVMYKDSSILKITISLHDSKNKITFVDSSNILKGKLYNLSKSFGLKETAKGHFPYSFVNSNTLNYIGQTPDYKYWNDISKDEYKLLSKDDWSLKDECILYLKNDLLSLLDIMNMFNKYIFNKFDVQVTDCLTISRLSLNIFLKHYLKDSKIPIIKGNIYNDIKQAYYGGITEVYKPYGENLYYYDVNSLYPFASLNSMCSNKYTYIESYKEELNLDKLFGFFYGEIDNSHLDQYLGLLPYRTKDGIFMPKGKWTGWYFSEEYKFAKQRGYKIKILKGYNFEKEEKVFDEYVKDIYEIKSTTTNLVEKTVSKSLLNNIVGRFGLNIYKPVSELVNSEKLDMLLSTRECNSFKKINDNTYLISYYPKISKNVCEMYGYDYIKVLEKYNNNVKADREFKDVSLVIPAAVNAYARIYINKIKLDVLNRGGNIYYTDTDSIVTDIPLNDNMVGKELGQFKLEHFIKEGYFISSKTYGLINDENRTVLKSKGLLNNSLSIEKYKLLYDGVKSEGLKRSALRNFENGSVTIQNKMIILNPDSYTKRIKVFKDNKWIDTKPVNLINNEISWDDSLIKKNTKKIKKKFNFRLGFSLASKSFKFLKEIVLFFTSIILVTLLPDILDFDNVIIDDKSNNLKSSSANVIDVAVENKANYKNNSIFRSPTEIYDKSNVMQITSNNYNKKYVFDIVTCDLISHSLINNFHSRDEYMKYAHNFILSQLEAKRISITTSDYASIMYEIRNNKELSKLLIVDNNLRHSHTFINNKDYNLVSKKYIRDYENWVINPHIYETPKGNIVKNELSLLDELQLLNDNYTHLLKDYKNIYESIDKSLYTPRSIKESYDSKCINNSKSLLIVTEVKSRRELEK